MTKKTDNNAKTTEVTLVVEELGYKRDFPIEQAERLLALEKNGGWKLPSDSKYKYVDGVISRGNTEKD